MSTTVETEQDHTGTELQFATFYVGDLLLGVNICQVQEINRQLDATKVPHAPKEVHGVINLRGDVATVIDLRTVLGMPPVEDSRNSRTLIVQSHGESIGILVDRISDILTISSEEIGRPPSNIHGVAGELFNGIYRLETELMIILDIDAILSGEP